jgi:hypothetical protein
MKMKNIILLVFTSLLAFMVSCSKVPIYDIPTVDGKIIIYEYTNSTNTGLTTLDPSITFHVVFQTAKAGDAMGVELLKQQTSVNNPDVPQWLPLAGTQKTFTMPSDLKYDITFTRAESGLNEAGDSRKISIWGPMDSHLKVFYITSATAVTAPQVLNTTVPVSVISTTDTAYFHVTVAPASGPYTGTVIAQRKNGVNDPWVDAGAPSFTAPADVPISGSDFAVGKDTMYYQFTTTQNGYTDLLTQKIVVATPFFFKKHAPSLAIGGAFAGINLILNTPVAATDANAIIAIEAGSIVLHGGSAWAVGGNSIEFVESDLATYAANNSDLAIAAFAAGTPSATADPALGTGVFVFRFVNGVGPNNTYYGMIKTMSIVPNTSVSFEYRIGNRYKQLSVLQ